jgi:hypothetical protein
MNTRSDGQQEDGRLGRVKVLPVRARGHSQRRERGPNGTAPLILQSNVSQPPGRGPVVGPGINYTGPREDLLEFVIFIV